jgi:histidyl-tRNA synthetase
MNLVGAVRESVAHVLVLAVDPALSLECAGLAAELRDAGMNVEVYGGDDKLAKQFKYADRSKIPLAVLYGAREKAAGIIKVRDLRAAAVTKEHEVPRGDLVARIKQLAG